MSRRLDINGHNFKWIIYAVDIVILVTVFSIFVNYVVEAMGWRNYDGDSRFYWNRYGHVFVFLLSYFLSVSIIKIKPKDLDSKLETVIRAGAQVVLMYIIFAVCVAILFHTFPGHLIMWSGLVNGFLIVLSHYLLTVAIVRSRRRPENVINTVFVGSDQNNIRVYDQLKHGYSTFSYNVLGFFSDSSADSLPADTRLLGQSSSVLQFLEGNDVGEVYCSLNPNGSNSVVNAIIKKCEEKFITFYYVPNMEGYIHRQMEFSQYGGVTLVSLHNEPLSDAYNRIAKRAFDILFSGIVLVTIYPLVWLVVAVGTKLSSPGPVLFRQQRTGSNGQPFTMLKFRSMKVNADADKVQATEDDPRKTRFGDFLRRTSIDELPQFINVFKGDMSVVGPRPHMELHTEMYSKLVDEYLVRHLCKPGITGWAQVSGCRGETKTVEEMAERVKCDIWYIENWSMLLDLRIILKTVLNVFRGDEQAY